MLYHIFILILDNSIMAIAAIMVVLLVRALIGKAPKKYAYILWAIVGIRLICPGAIGMPTSFSIYNLVNVSNYSAHEIRQDGEVTRKSSNTVKVNADYGENSSNQESSVLPHSNVEDKKILSNSKMSSNETSKTINSSKNQEGSGTVDQSDNEQFTALQKVTRVGFLVWIAGVILLIIRNGVLLIRIRKKVAAAVRFEDNIYECDAISTPFVFGLVAPKIYIPFRMEETERKCVIAHEKYHIKRKDNIFKIIAVVLCIVHWFNPFVWLAYFLMNRDMEMSCDEYVIKSAKVDIRKAYSEYLLGFATNTRDIGVGMLGFGESDTRKRVKHVMKLNKAGKWIGAVAVVLIILVGMCCLTDAKRENSGEWATPGDSTKSAMKEMVHSGKNFAIVAVRQVGEYELGLVFYNTDANEIDKKPESGYFSSVGDKNVENQDVFGLVCSKHGKKVDILNLDTEMFGEASEISFPVEGINLTMADYDGDGEKNDFALGQGQSENVMMGNFMNYGFFGVDSDGEVIEYNTSTENYRTITTMPGEYSPRFIRKDGQVEYTGLVEDGTDTLTTTIVRKITRKEAEKKKWESEQSIYQILTKTMIDPVVQELNEKGVWSITRDESEGTICYSIGNDSYEPTLRLDFTYNQDGKLLQYVSKEYGFVDGLSGQSGKYEDSQSISVVETFAKEYLDLAVGVEERANGSKTDNRFDTKLKSVNSKKWDSKAYDCFEDDRGDFYVVDIARQMMVFMDVH